MLRHIARYRASSQGEGRCTKANYGASKDVVCTENMSVSLSASIVLGYRKVSQIGHAVVSLMQGIQREPSL